MSFYNTNSETGETLKNSRIKTDKQDKIIIDFFIGVKEFKRTWTPEQVNAIKELENTPLTSIRRSFNTLMKQGRIEWTGKMAPGLYGKNVRAYSFVK